MNTSADGGAVVKEEQMQMEKNRWWLKEVWCVPGFFFCQSVFTCVTLAAPNWRKAEWNNLLRHTFAKDPKKTHQWMEIVNRYMNAAAARSDGASTRPSALPTSLASKQVLMLKFMINMAVLSTHSQRGTYRDAGAAPRCQASNELEEAKRPLKFLGQNLKTKQERSDCYRASVLTLWKI